MADLAGNPGEMGGVPEGLGRHQERLACDLIKKSTISTLEFHFSP